jgi:hypothetical protein
MALYDPQPITAILCGFRAGFRLRWFTLWALWLVITVRRSIKVIGSVVLIFLLMAAYIKYGAPLIKSQPDTLTVLGRIEKKLKELPDAVAAKVVAMLQAPQAPPTAEPALVLELTPFVILKRTRVRIDKEDHTFREYGLAAILHVLNKRAEPQYIGRLEVEGDVSADCSEYLAAFGKDGQDIRKIMSDCANRKPYHQISWVAWPRGETRVDPKGGEAIYPFRYSATGAQYAHIQFAPWEATRR